MKSRSRNNCPCGVSRWTSARGEVGGLAARRDQGSFLIMAVLFLSVVLTLVLSTMGVVNARVEDTRMERNMLIATNAAEAGLMRQIADIRTTRDMSAIGTPFIGLDNLDNNTAVGPAGYSTTYVTQSLTDMSNNVIAQYDVLVDIKNPGDLTERIISITCFAYVPTKAAYSTQLRDAIRSDAHVTLTVPMGPANVFDYAYFINHWGWFYGNNIVSNGNARSNGQFDFGGYASTINGSPRYLSSSGAQLLGYQDDNNDGVTDGTDGGVYAGMAIVGEQNINGMGDLAKNQHEYQEKLDMPNLSDLTSYEAKAVAQNGTISLGGTTIVNNVLGDDASEKKHVFLEGTAANPIVLNGPVVVRGSVIISGYVSGQGSIFASGNVYIPRDLKYLDPPATRRPTSNDQATTEAWRAANMTKDALGLYSAGHIVIGNYLNSSWQSYVSSWINHPSNKSKEDAGSDGIHNTKAGNDGITGTADDDVLEGDGSWTVQYYTAADQAAGRIPTGKNVGDVVPGSGEDIDGDGLNDGAIQMSEFNIPATLTSTNWAGNVPAGSPAYSAVSGTTFTQIDGVLYTNHALPALLIAPSSSQDIVFNGSIVSRNESIIYGARYLIMNHDERLSGAGGEIFGMQPPNVWKSMTLDNWEYRKDLPAGLAADPAGILNYYCGTSTFVN